MNKYIIVCLFFIVNLYAITQQIPIQNNVSTTQNMQQKSINSKEDLTEMLNALLEVYKMGDKGKAFIIGSLYSKEYNFQDGTRVKPDMEKALYYYSEAYKAGFGLAAIQIAIIDLIPKKRVFDALTLLENAMHGKLNNSSAESSIALAYAGIVLENLNQNKKYIEKAIDLLYPYAMQNNLSTLDYSLANLLNLDGRTKEANKFLNSACNNPNVPQQIWYMCVNGSEISSIDLTTGQPMKKDKTIGCSSAKTGLF